MDKKEIKDEFDFDLPEVEASAPTKPRVHNSGADSVCISCEG